MSSSASGVDATCKALSRLIKMVNCLSHRLFDESESPLSINVVLCYKRFVHIYMVLVKVYEAVSPGAIAGVATYVLIFEIPFTSNSISMLLIESVPLFTNSTLAVLKQTIGITSA